MKEIKVGKYTLESLTTGMYDNPETIYREYIQNSVDSIEEAVKNNLIKIEESKINIILDSEEDKITIHDNGMGIKSDQSFSILTDIGNSNKKYEQNRGFRGIGRLGGLSFCDKLRFISKYKDEKIGTIVEYDCVKLKKMLIPGQYNNYDLESVLKEVVTFSEYEEDSKKHYFTVELHGIDIFTDLLEIEKIESYIKQTCPLPYEQFAYTKHIHDLFEKNKLDLLEFNIYIGTNKNNLRKLYKPIKYNFKSNNRSKNRDYITSMELVEIRDDEELLALGWYGKCNYYGAIIDKEIAGIRIRKGNILVKSQRIINEIFKEPRFNNWVQGEIFVISDKIIPNARRDDFEANKKYFDLINELSKNVGMKIQEEIRQASKYRNSDIVKKANALNISLNKSKDIEKKGFNSTLQKEKILNDLNTKKQDLEKIKTKDESERILKEKTINEAEVIIDLIDNSSNYKTKKLKGVINRKEKNILELVSEIMSKVLSNYLADEDKINKIIDEILENVKLELSRKDKK